jgi:hypothetical protein
MFSGTGSKSNLSKKTKGLRVSIGKANGSVPAIFYFGLRLPVEAKVSGGGAENRFTGMEFEGSNPLNCTGARGWGRRLREERRAWIWLVERSPGNDSDVAGFAFAV